MAEDDAASRAASNVPESRHGRRTGCDLTRRHILDAAMDLITDQGVERMTIRALVARTGLSTGEVYRLFESKHSILQAVGEREQRIQTRFYQSRASTDPLIELFDLIDLGAAYYSRRATFYKGLFEALSRASSSSIGWPLSSDMRRLLASATEIGDLRPDTPVDDLAQAFTRIGRSIASEWAGGQLSISNAREQLGRTCHLMLSVFFSASADDKRAALSRRYEPTPTPAAPARPRPEHC